MNLPNAVNAVISPGKIVGYLLSLEHRDGRSKAEFFTRFGFAIETWQELSEALMRHSRSNEVEKVEESSYGTRYIVTGTLETPDGRNPLVRTVWFIGFEDPRPRLVTAYPR
jgi:hypothetical protein